MSEKNSFLKSVYLNWKIYLIFLLLIVLLAFFYSLYVHESAHYVSAKILGYNATIVYNFLNAHNNISPPINNKLNLFYVAMMPYILDLFFVMILFILFLKLRKDFYFYLSSIPLINSLGNSPFLHPMDITDDFINLIYHGFPWLLIYMISLIPIILFCRFWLYFIKDKRRNP